MSFQDVRGEGFGAGVRRREPGHLMGLAAGGQRRDEGTAAGVGGGGAYQGPANALLQYQQQVTLYEQLRRSLGGPRDTDELRLQLSTQESVVKEVGLKVEGELGGQLRVSESLSKLEKDRLRAENSKLAKDFQRLKGKFEAGVQAAAARIRELEQARGTGVDGRQGGAVLSPQEAERLQLQLAQDDIDERILQEREEEIMAINQSVVKVNEIFRDLGELVNKQQEDIDRIEDNVQHSHAAAKSGLEQVEKAAKYQPGCLLS